MTQFVCDASGQRLRTFVEIPEVSRTITTYPFLQYEVRIETKLAAVQWAVRGW